MKQIITKFTSDPRNGARISWGGIFAGTLTILSLLVLLNLLGAGLGIITINPQTNPLMDSGVVFWFILSNVIAVFCGGLVAARAGGFSRIVGALHGFLSWALYIILSTVFYSSLMGNDIGTLIEIGAQSHSLLLFFCLLLGSLAGILGGAQVADVRMENERIEE